MYQIEVLTTSESQETRIVRFNPQAVQKALENSFENEIKVSSHVMTLSPCLLPSQIMSLNRCCIKLSAKWLHLNEDNYTKHILEWLP